MTLSLTRSFDDPPRFAEEVSSEEEKLDEYRKVCEEIRQFVGEL